MFGAAGIMVFLGGVLPLLGKLADLVFRGTVWGNICFWPSPVMTFWKAYEASYVRQAGPAEFWTAWGVLIGLSLVCLVIASLWLPRAWQEREVPMEQEAWDLVSSVSPEPDQEVEQAELLAAIGRAIARTLSPHQRRVLIALAVNGVPIDVLAERLNTNRGALYKTLHDARQKLRKHLEERGFALDAWLEEK
jgi:RNA polymerase sigma factor (sigma-70 family)